jgi:hypothetical protein
MSAIPWFLDTASKRWLAVLAVALLVSMAMIVRAFVNASFHQEEKTVTVEPQVSVVTEPVSTRTEPVWDNPGEVHETQLAPTDGRVSPFKTQVSAAEASRDEVHRQAEYFRKIMVNGKLPACYGSLTQAQVDEMEKKGITIQ